MKLLQPLTLAIERNTSGSKSQAEVMVVGFLIGICVLIFFILHGPQRGPDLPAGAVIDPDYGYVPPDET